MQSAKKFSLSIVLALLALVPVSAAVADNGQIGGYTAMAGSDGGNSGEREDMTKAEFSEESENRGEPREMDVKKSDMKLQRRLREHPIDAANGDTAVRVTAKTSDRGEEMRQFIRAQGGTLGSCHGNIITAQIPYRALPALSRLTTVTRIEGDIMLMPQKK